MEGVEEDEEDSRDFAARSCARGTSRPCASCPTGTSRPCASCQYICPAGAAVVPADAGLLLLLSRRAAAYADASGSEETGDGMMGEALPWMLSAAHKVDAAVAAVVAAAE